MRIIRTGKVIIRYRGKHLFDVVLMRLTGAAVELLTWYGNVIMGYGRSKSMGPWVAGCATGTKRSWN